GRVNGLTDLVLTKLDVLTGFEKVPVCVAYDVDGVRHDEMPIDQTAFGKATPIYEELDGWWEDISQVRSWDELPVNARRYVEALEEMSGTRISSVGVGPDREATIVRHDLLGCPSRRPPAGLAWRTCHPPRRCSPSSSRPSSSSSCPARACCSS